MASVFDDVFTEDAAAGGSVFDDVFQTPDIKPTPYEQRALIAPEIRPPTGMEAGTEFLTAVAPPIVEAERAAADLAGRGIEWAGNRVLDVANLPTTIANVAQARRQGIAGFTPDELSQANIPGQALRIEELPRPQFPRTSEEELAQINAGAALRTAAGIGNLVSGTVQGLAPPYASPEVGLTLPFLGGEGLINRIAMAAFAEETIRALPEEIQTAIETVKDPKATLEKKIEAVGKPAVTAYFARAMAKHAVGKPMVKAPFESVAEREGQLAPDIIRLRPGEEPIWQLEPKPLPTPSLIGPAGAMALQAQPQIQRPSEETPERISPAGEVPRVAPAGAAPMVLPPGADRTFFNPLGRRITGEELVRPPGAAPGEGATPLPEAQDLVRMTPNDMAEWRKGIRYGWMTSENIARNMSREDYTLLKNELPEMHRAMKDLLTQYGKERDANGGKETRESERIMGVYNKIQFKSQTFKEIIQDWDKLEAENRAAQPAVEPPTPSVESPEGALQTGAKAPTVSPVSATVTPKKPVDKPLGKKAAAKELKRLVIENARLFVTSRAADIIEAGEAEGGDSASHAARSRYSEALRNLFQAVANKIGFTEGELGGRNATGARAAALPKLKEWLEKQKKPEAPVEERFIISKNPKTGEWDILDSKTERIIPAGPSEETAREMARIWNEEPQEKTEAPVEVQTKTAGELAEEMFNLTPNKESWKLPAGDRLTPNYFRNLLGVDPSTVFEKKKIPLSSFLEPLKVTRNDPIGVGKTVPTIVAMPSTSEPGKYVIADGNHRFLAMRERGDTEVEAWVPKETQKPKLLPGEKQGDLISSTQTEDITLVGEKGVDAERAAAEKAKAEADKKAAEEAAARQQQTLPGTQPKRLITDDQAKTLRDRIKARLQKPEPEEPPEGKVEAMAEPGKPKKPKLDARRSGRISAPEGAPKEEGVFVEAPEGGEEGLIFGGKFGMPLETEERGPMVRASDIIDKLANLMNRPIRIGGISLRKAAGVFKPDEQIARLRVANDLEAAAHETAHMLERAHRYALGKGIKEVDRKAWYKTMSTEAQKEFKDLDYDPSKKRIYEGWAEFMRHYLSIPGSETSYPNAYKWFRDVFLKDNPHLEQGIKEIRKDFTGYGQQGSVLRVKSMLRLSGQEKNLPMAQQAKRVYHTFRRLFEDDVYDIERVEREILGEGKTALGAVSPSKLARTVTQKSAAIAREWGLHGITDIAGNKVGPSLNEIFKKPGIRGQEEDALTYAVARRAIDLHSRGINPGIMLQDARNTVAKLGNPAREQFAKDITEFNEHALQYLVDAGVIGPETKAAVRKLNPVYLPFFRVFDKEGGGAGLGGRRIGDQPKGFKAIRGSGREIRDPIEAMTAQMERFISIANKTRVARSLVSLVKNAPGFEKFGRFVGEVPPDKFPFEFDLNSIKKQLQAAGIDTSGADLDQTITLFMNSPRTPKGGNIVGFWLNGKKRFFELDPELYRSIMALDFHRVHPLLDFLFGKLTRTTRLGATGVNPGFTLFTNLVRDYWTMMNQGRFNPLQTTKLWLEHLGRQVGMRESEVLNLWKATGGEVAQPLGLDRKSIQQFRESILANTPKRLAYNIVRHPWEFLREAFSITEAAPRLAEFESTLRSMGWKPGTPLTENMAIEAANNAAEVTVNFSRAGSWGRSINQVVAFHNPNIQGLAKFARSHRRSPVASGVRGLGTITSLAILNWYMNHKDEDWKNKPAWLKYGFLNWKIGDNWIRIPMPFEWWFAYGALPIAALEAIDKKKPGELEKLAKQATSQLSPPVIPSAASPLIEVLANKSFYSGKPIEPKSMQRLPVQERAMPYTAQTSKKVAQILSAGGVSVSPVQVEHVLRAETGGLYTDLIRASERTVGLSAEAPVREPADLPVVGRIFARDGESAVIDEMYDQMEHLMQKQATAKLYRQQGTPNWEKYELNGEEAAQLRDMQRASQRLTKLRKEYNASTDRQARRRIFSEMTDLAKQSLD